MDDITLGFRPENRKHLDSSSTKDGSYGLSSVTKIIQIFIEKVIQI